ncbi:MAG: hypothetical protein H0U19_00605, partial [Acidobacteria bacterium]|nr:hypothetical protein [Acidobacteriota bacterium]
RHTIITELAEMGVADHVLESISDHLSRRMLEHYSHVRCSTGYVLNVLRAHVPRAEVLRAELTYDVLTSDGLTCHTHHRPHVARAHAARPHIAR